MGYRRVFSVLATGAVIVGMSAIAGSAAPPPQAPTGQQIAQKLLTVKGLQLTGPVRAGLEMIARGDRQFGSGVNLDTPQNTGPAARTQQSQGGIQESGNGLANVLVNNPGEDSHFIDQTTQSETTIGVHGQNVVVGFNDSQIFLQPFLTAASNLTGYAYSSDGGKSFTDGGGLPNRPGENNLGDPWLGSDRAGNFYFSNLVISIDPFRGFNFDVGVAKSTDGGKTFGTPAMVDTQPEAAQFYSADKDALAVGRDPSVASRDNLYVGWDDFVFDFTNFTFTSGLPVSHSYDGASSWKVTYADRIPIFGPGCSFHQYIGAFPFVDAKTGALYNAAELISQDNPNCVFNPPPPTTFSHKVFKSTDGGQTWGPGIVISQVTSASPTGLFKLGEHQFMRDLEFPSLAQDSAGNLYDTWNDGGLGKSHVRLAKSSDGGATWTTSWVTTGGNDEIQPEMSADTSGLHILYYMRNADNTLDVVAANSSDGGATWSFKRITSQSFPGVYTFPQFDPIIAFAYMGDYIANVSDGTNQYFAWGDNRNMVTNFLWQQGRHDPDVFFAKQTGDEEG